MPKIIQLSPHVANLIAAGEVAVSYTHLFTFIYSPRPGTPAASLPDPATRQEKNQWFDRLCAAQNAISEEKHRAYVEMCIRDSPWAPVA